MNALFDMLKKDIDKNEFRKVKNEMYLKHKEVFYVLTHKGITFFENVE